MRFKTWICTALFTLIFCTSALAGPGSVQVVSFSQENTEELVIELTGTKVITEDFSFKFPEDWNHTCLLIPSGNSYEIYEKETYESDGSGLLFSIDCLEDAPLQELADCSILSFCGNRTYILVPHYEEPEEEIPEEFYASCEAAVRTLKKSFVALIRED